MATTSPLVSDPQELPFQAAPLSHHDVHLLDELFTSAAMFNGSFTFAQVIEEHGVRTITFGEFHNDFSALAVHLPRVVESTPLRNPVIGILARSSYAYAVHMIALVMMGWTVMPISPRNSSAALEHLMLTSGATHLLVEAEFLKDVSHLSQFASISIFHDIAQLDKGKRTHIPSYTSEEKKLQYDRPVFLMHTSGSTGHPKLIPWNHRFLLGVCIAVQGEYKDYIQSTLYSMGPLYHAMGVLTVFTLPPTIGAKVVITQTQTPLTGEIFMKHVRLFHKIIVMAIPSILEEVHSMGLTAVNELAARTSIVIFGGAPIAKIAGDTLVAQGVLLRPTYGSTEVGMVSSLAVVPKGNALDDWEYTTFRSGYTYKMLDVTDHAETKELLIMPGEDTPAVCNCDDPKGYLTGDLFRCHPIWPDFWIHVGRSANVTVLSNGEKTNNRQIESLLLEDGRVRHVVVFGTGRTQNGILVWPSTPGDANKFKDSIWSTVEAVNKVIPQHSRIVNALLIVMDPARPFVLTVKGIPKLQETVQLYSHDIEAAYSTLYTETNGIEFPEYFDASHIFSFLRSAVTKILRKEILDDDDFFGHGMDSLQASMARSAVAGLLENFNITRDSFPSNVIHRYSTIRDLGGFILHGGSSRADGDALLMQSCIERFSTATIRHASASDVGGGEIIVLTGSTGGVGSWILSQLLDRLSVEKIYCLGRPSRTGATIKQRQMAAFKAKGLDPHKLEEHSNRISFLDIDLSDSCLGLEGHVYEELRVSVTHIIHAAWQLNFNMVFSSFEETHVRGVFHLMNLALASPKAQCPRFVFLSSIAALQEWPTSQPIPETPIDCPPPLNGGYGQAKYVSEKILQHAEQSSGLNVTIIRVGQLSGASISGVWSENEYVPILLKTSVALGLLPDDLPPVRWLPVDIAAKAIVAQSFASSAALAYFNLQNPHSTPWCDIVGYFSTMYPSGLRTVPMGSWIDVVGESARQPAPAEVTAAAAQLTGFFSQLMARGDQTPVLELTRSASLTPELMSNRLTFALMRTYMKSMGVMPRQRTDTNAN